MIKTSKQLKDLIRNLSKKNAADAQILLRNYMMERFLERISLSEYRGMFILKGGILVASMVGLDARSTMDLDATIKGTTLNKETVETIISGILSAPIDDGVAFQVKNISDIMDEAEYPGMRISMSATFDGTVTPVKIDISTGDVITPGAIRYHLKLMLEERSISLWAYNLETVLAEKLESIISRATTNSRMRDFYDIYILSKTYQDTLDANILRQALAATSHNRQSEHMLLEGDEILKEVETSPIMQKLWESYRKKFSYVSDIEWTDVMSSVCNLYSMVS
ncbi:MAG: nucleotidyl transferase AbiEii/AbiGii toxin family protein [Lachnospiraceae bacterium]|nr:nucleotidyl transferase AbiEii/AbiGii toxin family protein [Lachnospiraceae bacterium]